MTHLNLAEKASAMNWGWVGSWKLLDVNLMKLSKGVGYVTGKKKSE